MIELEYSTVLTNIKIIAITLHLTKTSLELLHHKCDFYNFPVN